MSSIFSRTNEYVQDVKRNTFDLSHQNNLTLNFGKLYPVYAQEVIPGDSYSIRPTFAFEFMPMLFPVQTRMRANLHFFYVRNRNLWKDFPDFIANTKEVDPPYLDMNGRYDNLLKVGQIGDYFGLPVTNDGDYGTVLGTDGTLEMCSPFSDVSSSGLNMKVDDVSQLVSDVRQGLGFGSKEGSTLETLAEGENLVSYFCTSEFSDSDFSYDDYSNGFYMDFSLRVLDTVEVPDFDNPHNFTKQDFEVLFENLVLGLKFHTSASSVVQESVCYAFNKSFENDGISYEYHIDEINKTLRVHVYFSKVIADYLKNRFGQDTKLYVEMLAVACNPCPHTYTWTNSNGIQFGRLVDGVYQSSLIGDFQFSFVNNAVYSIDKDSSPYYDSVNNPEGLKISALPFRAYESIYNAFYRDIRNNPLIVDGQPEYNKYITNNEGGADTTPYELHYRNWEQDFLTTAVQSPQQGAAPLVGISSNGLFKFQDENGSVYTAQAKFADDGETLTGFEVQSSDMPVGNLRSLVDLASSGISINDLRNVNSLQRWLENNMRKGLRLKDQIKAHFNVDIRYDELDMPEFIGGCSEDIRVNMVTQTSSDVEDSPLGSYAGQASCVGTSRNNITHYCDEHGYIIGILSITPVPNYSQLLPKHFIKRNVLDYFFPEFGHIGYQPIRYNEVCPVQTFNAGDSLDDTFGYQRAWYDYLARVDEVHGLFRTSLRNYLMNRVFDRKPDLSEQFLLVNPVHLNDVFATNVVDPLTGDVQDDKIFGQVYFDVKAKRPIPMFGIPRLE